MTERLYYQDSFLRTFRAQVVRVDPEGVVLDRTAFYPTSGGQPHDRGWLAAVPVGEVFENDRGEIVHVLEGPAPTTVGETVQGEIDWPRRADHIQQHSGQHLLSAVFLRLFGVPTVSFHLGAEISTIDLGAPAVTPGQARAAEELANEIVFEDRPVRVFFATPEEARALPLRKDVAREGTLRLVEIPELDLTPCGGTHVARTGQIGAVLVRKAEKSRQGVRVEFVCGRRAVRLARVDCEVLAEAANLLTTHPHEMGARVRKQVEALKAADKERQKLLETLASYEAREIYAATQESNGVRQLVKLFDAADPGYVRSLAARFAAQGGPAQGARALFAIREPPTLVLAQTPGLAADLGALVKRLSGEHGLRGGGSRDAARAGASDAALSGTRAGSNPSRGVNLCRNKRLQRRCWTACGPPGFPASMA